MLRVKEGVLFQFDPDRAHTVPLAHEVLVHRQEQDTLPASDGIPRSPRPRPAAVPRQVPRQIGTAAEPCLTTATGLPRVRRAGAGFVMLLSCMTRVAV